MKLRKNLIMIALLCIVALIFAIGGFFVGKNCAPAADKPSVGKTAERVMPNVFEIKCGNKIATGFCLYNTDEGAVAVACMHVVEGEADSAMIKLYGEDEFSGEKLRFLGYDPDYDIAVYRIKDYKCKDLQVSHEQRDFVVGEQVFLLGNDSGHGIAAYEGIISVPDDIVLCEDSAAGSNIDGKHLPAVRITAAVNAGSSGAPVFTYDGKLVGMGFYQVFGTTERPVYDTSYAIPACIVRAVAEACEVHYGAVVRDKCNLRNELIQDGDKTIRLLEAYFPALGSGWTFRIMEGRLAFSDGREGEKKEVYSICGKRVASVSEVLATMIECRTYSSDAPKIEFVKGSETV